MYPYVNITRTQNTVTITISPSSVQIVNEVGPFSPLPQLKFAMTPWGQSDVAEARVVDIETGSLSTYPQGRAGFNTLYAPVMTEGQGDPNGTNPPVNPSWCAFPALYATDPNQDVPVTSAEATTRGLPQDTVRPTQSLLTGTRPKMRGWVELDVYGPAAWVAEMASEYDNWIARFVTPISPDNNPLLYRGMVVLNWERLKAFTFDFNRIGADGDASWTCYRQWRQLSTGGTGTLASPWNTVTGGTETEQQSRVRFRNLVADFMAEVVDLIKSKLPLCHLVWFNEPVPQNWYQLDPTNPTWNGSDIATIDGTPMTRAEAIRYEALGWMATDLFPLFDSISVQSYDFLPPGSTSGASDRYALSGGSESWAGSRPANDVSVAHNTFTERTRLSTFYFNLMDDVANTVDLPVVAWLSPVSYFSQTTGYRLSAADQRTYLDIIDGYGSGWNVAFWIDCLNYGWTNGTLGNLTSEQRWTEVQEGLKILNPIVATLTGDPGNGGIAVDFPASADARLPQILGPTYSGLEVS